MAQPRTDTLVIIPTYCERETLDRIVPAVLAALDADVLIVDDESPDGTGQLADALAESDPRVSVMHRVDRPRGSVGHRDHVCRC